MPYISYLFFGFLLLALASYYIAPIKARPYVLLCANLVFYAYAGLSSVLYLAVLIVLSYGVAFFCKKPISAAPLRWSFTFYSVWVLSFTASLSIMC